MKALLFRFHLALAIVLPLVVGMPASSAPTEVLEGYWVLDRMYRNAPNPIERSVPGVLLSYKLSSRPTTRGVITMMDFFEDNKPAVTLDEYDISWEWSAIPVVGRPGDQVPMTLKGIVSTQPHWKNGMVGITYPNIKVDFYRPSGANEEWLPINGFTPAIVQFNSSDPSNLSGLANSTGTYPTGQEGDLLSLTIYIEHPSVRWDWAYIYEWREGPPPASIPPPVPAGQPTLDPNSKETGVIGVPTDVPVPPRDPSNPDPRDEPDDPGDPDDPLRSQTGSLTIQADRRTVAVGDTVTVPIRMLDGNAVGNLDYRITYDPAIVRPLGQALKGNLLSNASMQSNVPESGAVMIAFATTERIDGDGTLAEITFEAIGQPGQKTVLGVEVTMFNESTDVSAIARIPGEIEILTAGGRIKGDVNNNGILDAADALEALKMAVRLIPMDLIADLDDDQTVTSADARIILRRAAER